MSDGRVKITFDEKHKVFASGGFGSGHVAPEPATMLLIVQDWQGSRLPVD